jgi:hypothetical protein
MHKDRKIRVQQHGRNTGGKTIVLGMLDRKNKKIRTTIVKDRTKATMQPEIRANVAPGSQLMSDEWANYYRMDSEYVHNIVNHLEKYVDGNVHTNGVENFWSLLKRGIGGTYVSVEPFHLFRYVDEQAFRYNHRTLNDSERFAIAMSQIVGRRLTYKELIGKEGETAPSEGQTEARPS